MQEKIGHYTVVSELGRGGMGVVYKAREESLDRFVAIKVLTERLTEDDTFLQRFVREARAAAGVSHPNIVQIFFIGEEQGKPYFVMEYVTGQSLNRLLRSEGRIGNPRAAQIILQAAHGLAAAHDRGIIHRDIKPGNLIVDARGIVKIADFGLALPAAAETRLTATGMLVGTPGYLAPEQCRGEQADHRTDIYALGVTFYELLTGTQPFKGESPLALLRQILDEEPPDIAALNPDTDEETKRILAKMITKDRAQRYQSCHEIIADLEQYLADRGVRSVTSGLAALTPSVRDVGASTAATQVIGGATTNVSGAPTVQLAATAAIPRASVTAPDNPMVEPPTVIQPTQPAAPAPAAQFAQAPVVAQAAAFVPAPVAAAPRRSSSRGLLIVAILVLFVAGAVVAGYMSFKMFRAWRGGKASTESAATQPVSSAGAPASGPAQKAEANALSTAPPASGVLLSQGVKVPAQPVSDSASTPSQATPPGSQTQAGQVAAAPVAPPGRLESGVPAQQSAALSRNGSRRAGGQADARSANAAAEPARAASGVAVAVVGDRGLVTMVAGVVMEELQAAGLEAVDAQTLPATEDLLRGGDVSTSRLIDSLRHEGSAVLLLVRVDASGQRELSYMGRSDTAYSSRVTLTSYDLATGRPFGSAARGSIEYTSLSAQRESEKVVAPLARSAAEGIRNHR